MACSVAVAAVDSRDSVAADKCSVAAAAADTRSVADKRSAVAADTYWIADKSRSEFDLEFDCPSVCLACWVFRYEPGSEFD